MFGVIRSTRSCIAEHDHENGKSQEQVSVMSMSRGVERSYPSRSGYKGRLFTASPPSPVEKVRQAVVAPVMDVAGKLAGRANWKWSLLIALAVIVLASPARRPALKLASAWIASMPLTGSESLWSRLGRLLSRR